MDSEESVVSSYFFLLTSAVFTYRKRKNTARRNRRWSVRPLNRVRRAKGFYRNLITKMIELDEEQFFKFSRMSYNTFKVLLNLVADRLRKYSIREPVCPEERLLITLYYLAHGCSMQSVAWSFYLGKATICCIIKETCQVLWDVLMPVYLPPLSLNDFENKAQDFFNLWNLPNCCGAVDGKHIDMQCPGKSGSQFFCNYKKKFSMVLMAMCDAQYFFTYVDIGAYGSANDNQIFKESDFGKGLENGTIPIPPPRRLPLSSQDSDPFPFFIAADAIFPLRNYILRPYPGKHLTVPQRIFNYRLSRGRRTIENAFGILSARWRILRSTIVADVSTVEKIIGAVVCLHNFVKRSEDTLPSGNRKYCPPSFVDRTNRDGSIIPGQWRDNGDTNSAFHDVGRIGSNNAPSSAIEMRIRLTNYFQDIGAVPWQWDSINTGLLPYI